MIFNICNTYHQLYKKENHTQKEQLKKILYNDKPHDETFYNQFDNPKEIEEFKEILQYLHPKGVLKTLHTIPKEEMIKTTFKNRDAFTALDGKSYAPIREFLIEFPNIVEQFHEWLKSNQVTHNLPEEDYELFIKQENTYTEKNEIIDCAPGAGKTTTILNQIKHLKHKNVQYIVFNRKNKDEAIDKLKITSKSNIKIDTHCKFQEDLLEKYGYKYLQSQELLKHYNMTNTEETQQKYKHYNTAQDENTLYVLIAYIVYEKCEMNEEDFSMKLNELVYEIMAETEYYINNPEEKPNQDDHTQLLAHYAFRLLRRLLNKKMFTIETEKQAIMELQTQQQIKESGTMHLFLDEVQDSSKEDFIAIDFFLKEYENYTLVSVGDMREEINQFRGGDLDIFKYLETFYKERNLKYEHIEQNKTYRVGKNIVEYSNKLIPEYQYETHAKHESSITISKQTLKQNVKQQIEYFKQEETQQRLIRKIAILAITNEEVIELEQTLNKEIQELKEENKEFEIITRLNLKKDNFIYNTRKELREKTNMNRVEFKDFFQEQCKTEQEDKTKNIIYIDISTVHKYKGLEAHAVIFESTDAVDEQTKNIKFVAYSRAINHLVILE